MMTGVIEGFNCIMKGNGDDVQDLHVIVSDCEHHGPSFTSAWFPTPAELRALAEGKPVYLTFYSATHPAVYLGVKP